jgi:hypothetical protein
MKKYKDPVLQKMAKNWDSHKGQPLLSEKQARSILKSAQFKNQKSQNVEGNKK